MKTIIVAALFALSSQVSADPADCLPAPGQAGFTPTISYVIESESGVVADSTVHLMGIPMRYDCAMALKYIRMLKLFDQETKTYKAVLKAGGDPRTLMK